MSKPIKVYQNPACSKSRATLAILNDRGVDFESINYYETPLSAAELRGLIDKLGISARDLLRTDEPIYRTLNLGERDVPDDELIALMVENPDLMQRPIVVSGERAVLARPPEIVEELL
jgi:arsenate reductase (glutaredoxin)